LDKKKAHPYWRSTETGRIALSLEAFRDYYSSSSPGLGGAMVRYLYTKQSLNGFLPAAKNSKRKSFWEFVGSDKRVRPYYGIYGAQSARSQPGATGFLPLKANWMRCFITPPPGRAIAGLDYSSQEFLISALLSEDQDMIDAYHSGDPYLYFGKLDGAIPQNGTKETHAHERLVYKTVTLGISYLMGATSLSFKLSTDLGKKVTEDEAQDLINRFYDAFPDFALWQEEFIETYMSAGHSKAYVKLPCGWYMFGDNRNPKSVGNVPIQGFGSSIMRKAVSLAQDKGLDVIYTLHDAVYIEYDEGKFSDIKLLHDCMDEAFGFYFPDHVKKYSHCRIDSFTWSPRYTKGSIEYEGISIDKNSIYLDSKGERDYFKYQEYLTVSHGGTDSQ